MGDRYRDDDRSGYDDRGRYGDRGGGAGGRGGPRDPPTVRASCKRYIANVGSLWKHTARRWCCSARLRPEDAAAHNSRPLAGCSSAT